MLQLLSGLFNGISIGSVLLIAALGLAIVFGLMGVINLAHGELMMLGAYTTYVVQNAFKPLGDPWFASYIIFALPAAFIVAGLAGLILERGVIRYLYGRPLETLLATWGVSLILRQFVRSVSWGMTIGILLFCLLYFGATWILRRRPNWDQIQKWAIAILLPVSAGIAVTTSILIGKFGPNTLTRPWFSARNVDVTAPAWLRGGIPLGNIQLPYARMFIIVLTILCLVGVYWFLNRSSWGLRIRAVTQNREMSACLGIPTETVDALTFALGSGLAGIAGCAITLLGSVGPNLGGSYIVDTFMVVVVGGVGKLVGSIVAAMAIGTVNYLIGSGTIARMVEPIPPLADFFTFFATTSMAKVMVFALIIAFLQIRPAGIFPQKGRTVDA
ncbi:MAG: branched-chain amino acid ABC transporter permease [Cyanobacteriota bacterium]|nr:branched-chain amino acid ABC transporter permease [Cyanobacteriota bacterium]